VVGLLYETED
jgi:hypothetical protein